MATYTFASTQYQSSLATYQACCQAISTAFSTIGWAKTSDTGQSTWSSVPAAGAYRGYEIWKMTDSLQATYPVFLRVDYGCASESVNRVCLKLTLNFGGATNGSGHFVGGVSGAAVRVVPYSSDTVSHPCYCSGAANRIAFVMGYADSASHHAWGVERSKDATGADNSDGVMLQVLNKNATYKISSMFISASGAGALQGVASPMAGQLSGWVGGKGYVNFVWVVDQVGMRNPGYNFVLHLPWDVPVGAVYPLKIGSTAHSYFSQVIPYNTTTVCSGSTALYNLDPGGTTYGLGCSMIWE